MYTFVGTVKLSTIIAYPAIMSFVLEILLAFNI